MIKKISLRDATQDDCRDLWVWRNDPDIRKNSFNTQEIRFEEHQAWFQKAIGDKNIKIYIAEYENRFKAGQIRFDTKDEVLININLNPDFLGKGLGSQLIAMSTKSFLQQNPGVKKVVAMVLEENDISKKAFQKAGYRLVKNDQKDGRKVCVFAFEAGYGS